MSHLIEVAFRGNRKEFFRWSGDAPPPLTAAVVVEADRGEDFGRVHATGELAEVRCRGCAHGCGTASPERAALRLATRDEAMQDRALDTENESTRRRAIERVKANGLVMKLTDAEWQWDRRKLTIYFTAERRVDFRGLVRDLAALFRTRIELKQIGVRDEAKRLSGIGRCGREYCSASWLPDLRPVNLGVAKDQKLSLNPQQISGACGRLMCCLRYEHDFYVQSRRRFPKEGRILHTKAGEEKVISSDIFNERITLRSAEGDTRVVALAELREEVGGFGELPVMVETVVADAIDETIAYDTTESLDRRMLDETGMTSEHPVVMMDPVDTAWQRREDAANAADAADTSRANAELVAAADPPDETEPLDAVLTGAMLFGAATSNASTRDTGAVDGVTSTTPISDVSSIDISTNDASVIDTSVGDVAAEDEAGALSSADAKRRRRRGRRGGRRLRAAEERRRGETEGAQEQSADALEYDESEDHERSDDQ